jgi:Major Facilitator Superfamily
MQNDQQRSNPVALGVALAAFTVCFFAWSMLGPLGPTLQTHLHLSDFQLALAVAIPVVLGSVMRIPMGILSDRFGGRIVFTLLMAYSVIPLVLLALFHNSFGAVVVLGFLLGVTGSSFAVGVPFVNRVVPRRRRRRHRCGRRSRRPRRLLPTARHGSGQECDRQLYARGCIRLARRLSGRRTQLHRSLRTRRRARCLASAGTELRGVLQATANGRTVRAARAPADRLGRVRRAVGPGNRVVVLDVRRDRGAATVHRGLHPATRGMGQPHGIRPRTRRGTGRPRTRTTAPRPSPTRRLHYPSVRPVEADLARAPSRGTPILGDRM